MEVNNYLQQKADEFSQAMEATAAGDMTQRMETEGENESMDRIANEFNSMIEELERRRASSRLRRRSRRVRGRRAREFRVRP